MANHEDELFERCKYCGHFGFSCTKKQSKDCENMKDPNPRKEEWEKIVDETRENLLGELNGLKDSNKATRKPIFSGRGVKIGPLLTVLILITVLHFVLKFFFGVGLW